MSFRIMNSLCKRKRKREHLLVSYYYLRFFEMPSLTHLFDLAVPVNVKGRKVCHGDLLLQHLQPRLLLLGLDEAPRDGPKNLCDGCACQQHVENAEDLAALCGW